ncbi:MAG: Flp pilus assembly protein CpaB [Bryobacteraceae bacterium]|jgi:pilus assembly protein CpaB
MNKRFVSVVVFALFVAGVFTLLFYRLIVSRINTAPAPVATTPVLVAARNLDEGTLVREGDVDTTAWVGAVPQQAIMKKEDAVGRGVISKVFQGEPLLESRLAAKGAGAGLAAKIPKGWRAVALRVNDIIGVAGFVVPGMRVDIIILGAPPGTPATLGTLSKTLLQSVEVLSAGQDIRKDPEGKPISVPVITVLVKPEDAEKLSLANNETRIQLVLRNPLDEVETKTPGTAMGLLFSGQKLLLPGAQAQARTREAPRVQAAPPAPKPKPPVVVEVIQGGERKQTKFQEEPED